MLDGKLWWEGPNSVRIPLAISLAAVLGFRIFSIIKNKPKRSSRVRRIEVIIATTLWAFIAVSVALLFLIERLPS